MAGKKYISSLSKIDKKKSYSPLEAAKLVKEVSTTKFDSTVDVAIKLDVDTTQSDQQLRAAISLPHGNGKAIKILAICEGSDMDNAKAAGADFVGSKDVLEKIKGGWLEFDLIITTPKFMIELGKLGKQLGPRGLMPNPKAGTVTQDISKTVQEFKKGKQEYRTDKDGNIHLPIGKVSFSEKQLSENIEALIATIKSKRPSSVKGAFFENISISSTMSPSIKITLPKTE